MPKGPRGEKRPADAIGLAVMVGRIATGEIEDTTTAESARDRLSEGGKKGGGARAIRLTREQREEAARLAAEARWRREKP